jgi:hypothetical protein
LIDKTEEAKFENSIASPSTQVGRSGSEKSRIGKISGRENSGRHSTIHFRRRTTKSERRRTED